MTGDLELSGVDPFRSPDKEAARIEPHVSTLPDADRGRVVVGERVGQDADLVEVRFGVLDGEVPAGVGAGVTEGAVFGVDVAQRGVAVTARAAPAGAAK
jgi:hypothetical protein